ncbi:MAG: YdcF family protein [Rubritepida sp.]|nr:YdcF family protein [Rubritepida sp.]
MQGVLVGILLPPLLLALVGLLAGLLAWRGRRWGGLVAALCAVATLLLATPLVSGALMASLEREVARPASVPGGAQAIIILGGDVAHGRAGHEVGMLTLERLRAGAALQRATGLPILVTGGVLGRGEPPLAALMARSLREDFNVPVRWIEGRAGDTRDNAVFAAEILRADGIGEALLVTHAWHMPRALGAFARRGFPVRAYPLRVAPADGWGASSFAPRPDHLAESWFALREWAGRVAYALRDGGP